MTDKVADLLSRALENPDLRGAFFMTFLAENVFVPVNTPTQPGVAVFSLPDVPDFTWAVAEINGVPTVPCFTSKEKLDDFLTKVAGWEGRWISTPGRDLLTNMAGSEFLHVEINPASQHGVGLSPDMIRQVLFMAGQEQAG